MHTRSIARYAEGFALLGFSTGRHQLERTDALWGVRSIQIVDSFL